MRINEFLNSEEQVDHIIKYIINNCSQSLTSFQSSNNPLFSGKYDLTVPFSVMPTPINRKPRGIDESFQKFVDTCLITAGFKALRSNSIYCIGEPDAAENFGNLYMIFPVNGFDFIWSEKFFYTNDAVIWKFLPTEVYNQLLNSSYDYNLINQNVAQYFVSNMKYSKKNFKEATGSGHEVLIHGKYVQVACDSKNMKIFKTFGFADIFE